MRLIDEKETNRILKLALLEVESNKQLLDIFNSELLDGELLSHSIGVSRLAIQLMLCLNFDELNIIDTAIGALFHDIGKLDVPKEILYKPTKLVDDEFNIVKKHPLKGYEILSNIGVSTNTLNVVRWHHEKLDGSGYPDGIKDIPINVQIVTIADIFSAMMERRSYHEPISLVKTMRYIDSLKVLNNEGVDALFDSIID